MRIHVVLFFVFFVSCTSNKKEAIVLPSKVIDTLTSQYTPQPLIPAHVISYLSIHMPGWRIIDTADYDNLWWSFYDRDVVPYFVKTDINDDQLIDYALLIKKEKLLKLFLIITINQTAYKHYTANGFIPPYSKQVSKIQHGLAIEPPDQIDVVYPKERSLLLPSNGIALMQLEQKHSIFYIKNDSLQCFYMQ